MFVIIYFDLNILAPRIFWCSYLKKLYIFLFGTSFKFLCLITQFFCITLKKSLSLVDNLCTANIV